MTGSGFFVSRVVIPADRTGIGRVALFCACRRSDDRFVGVSLCRDRFSLCMAAVILASKGSDSFFRASRFLCDLACVPSMTNGVCFIRSINVATDRTGIRREAFFCACRRSHDRCCRMPLCRNRFCLCMAAVTCAGKGLDTFFRTGWLFCDLSGIPCMVERIDIIIRVCFIAACTDIGCVALLLACRCGNGCAVCGRMIITCIR